jgi:UDP-N-acetylglucosamine 4-epimerase
MRDFNNYNMNISVKFKKILITGGAGFIGSNLCEYFLNRGAVITCLDNFATGRLSNIEAILNHPNFTLIEGDIRDLQICLKACANQDYILHQAALGSVPRSIDDPITTNEVNVSGFLNMLMAAKNSGVKRFVYAASLPMAIRRICPRLKIKLVSLYLLMR